VRCPWRVALFPVLFAASYVFAAWLASSLFERPTLVAQVIILAGATVGATWPMMRWVEHRPFVAVGFGFDRPWPQEAIRGAGLGVVLAGGTVAVEKALGLITFQPSGISSAAAVSAGIPMMALLIFAATSEELLFRGYPFQRVVEGAGPWAGVGIFSSLFGGIHALNPHATALSVLNTVLAGVLLSLAYLATRALWFPIGLHFAWNTSLALGGLPVSGLHLMQMPWQAVPASQYTWLHGGSYGPEGGLVASIVLVGGVTYLLKRVPPSAVETAAPTASRVES